VIFGRVQLHKSDIQRNVKDVIMLGYILETCACYNTNLDFSFMDWEHILKYRVVSKDWSRGLYWKIGGQQSSSLKNRQLFYRHLGIL
jgi:hypothetical protein